MTRRLPALHSLPHPHQAPQAADRTGVAARVRGGLRWPLLLVVAVAMAGCSASRTYDITPSGDSLDLVRAPAIDIQNFHGNVTLEIDERLESVVTKVRAKIVGKDLDEETQQAMLDGLRVETRVESQAGGQVVRFVTDTDADPSLIRLDVRVAAPSCAGLRIENYGGRVDVRDAGGAIQITNASFAGTAGPIRVRTNRPITAPVVMTTDYGPITYQITEASAGNFELTSGDQVPEFSARSIRPDSLEISGRTVSASLNGGGNPVLLRTDAGAVRVTVTEDATAYKNTLR